MSLGRVLGVEIRLNYSWFIIFAIITWSLASGYLPGQYPGQSQVFYWAVGVAASISLFLSVLVHELSHSLFAKGHGVAVERITLHFFGGVSELEEEARTPSIELKMAAVGPLSSLALGLLFLVCWRVAVSYDLSLWLRSTVRYVSYINLALAIFNLTPAFPMDGGRILRSFLWRRSGDLLTSTRRAVQVSGALSLLIILIGIFEMMFYTVFEGLWLMIIGLFIKSSADANMNEALISDALKGVKVGDIMTEDVHTVKPGLTIQQLFDYHFSRYKHSGFPVVSEDQTVGMVTEHDIQHVPPEMWDEVRVKDIMKPSEELITVRPEDSVSDALIKIAKHDIGRLPVMEENKLVGIITRSDITKTIKMKLQFRS